jgi:hypothetical protein
VMPPHVAMGAVEKRQTEAGGARQWIQFWTSWVEESIEHLETIGTIDPDAES